MTMAAKPNKPGLLLVDDDPLIVDTLSIVLGQNFEVASATDHDTALDRLEHGGYGTCEACGNEIAEGRLAALPFATRCIRCAA